MNVDNIFSVALMNIRICILLMFVPSVAFSQKLIINSPSAKIFIIHVEGLNEANIKNAWVKQVYSLPTANGLTTRRFDTDTISKNTFTAKAMPSERYIFVAGADGYEEVTDTTTMDEGEKEKEITIRLKYRIMELDSVMVKAKLHQMMMKGDTILYNADAVTRLEGDMARDVLAQMPGIKIGEKHITVFNKPVKESLVDGKKIFGDTPTTALDHIVADDVVNIKAYERIMPPDSIRNASSERRQMVLNIETKSKMNSSIDGNTTASTGRTLSKGNGGNSHRFRDGIGLTTNYFAEGASLLASASHNNQNMLLRGGLSFISADERLPHYNKDSELSLALNHNWMQRKRGLSKLSLKYAFQRSESEREDKTTNNYMPSKDYAWREYEAAELTESTKNKHTINLSSQFRYSRTGLVMLSAYQSFINAKGLNRSIQSDRTDHSVSANNSLNRSDKHSNATDINVNINIPYIGEWLPSLFIEFNRNKANDSDVRSDKNSAVGETKRTYREYSIAGNEDNLNLNGGLSLSRRLGKNKADRFADAVRLSLNYNVKYQKGDIARESWDNTKNCIDTINTYIYRNNELHHLLSSNLHIPIRKTMALDVKAGMDYSRLTDDERIFKANRNYSFCNSLASVMLSIGQNKVMGSTHSMQYDMHSSLPAITQLRPATNNSNILFLTTGNPDLSNEVIHQLSWNSDILLNPHVGSKLDVVLSHNIIRRSIISAVYYYSNPTYIPSLHYTMVAGSSLTIPENSNDTHQTSLKLTLTQPLTKMRSSLDVSVLADCGNVPYIMNNDHGRTYSKGFGGNVALSCSVTKKLRMSLQGDIKYSMNDYGANMSNSELLLLNGELKLENDLGKSFFLKSKYSFHLQNNISLHDLQTENILNIYFGRHFLKGNGEVSITAYDIFNSYNSNKTMMYSTFSSRTTSVNYARFVALNLSWKFRTQK